MVRRRKIKKMMIMTRMMMIIMAEKTQNNTNEEKRRKINITFKAKAIQDLTFYPFFMCKKCKTTKNLTKTQHNATTSPKKCQGKGASVVQQVATYLYSLFHAVISTPYHPSLRCRWPDHHHC